MRILMVGAGATGGFYGGHLLKAGRDITFLLREGRADQIRANGLQIVTHKGEELTLHPKILSAEELKKTPSPFDLIILSTKSYQLAGAMEDIAPAVRPQTTLLPILNGMAQLGLLDARFGAEHVLAGTVRVVSNVDEQGRIVQMASLDEMSYGERSRERTERILAVDNAMQGAGFTAVLRPDILATLWQKWWILASMGVVCVLTRGPVGQAAAVAHGPELAKAILKECADIATANGYPPNPALYAEHTARLTEVGSTLTSSLYRDLMKGAPVEADHILGDLLDHAKAVSAPLITAAYVQLKVYERTRTQ